jgi:hypothetical protein
MLTDRGTPPTNRDPRPVGAVVALAVSSTIAMVGLLLDPVVGFVIGAVGVPVAVTLGWRMAPEAAAASGLRILAVPLWLGARTILLADAIIVGVVTPFGAAWGLPWVVTDHEPISWPLYLVGGCLALGVIVIAIYLCGLAFVGLPVMVLVMPAAIIWAALLKAIMQHGTGRALALEGTH